MHITPKSVNPENPPPPRAGFHLRSERSMTLKIIGSLSRKSLEIVASCIRLIDRLEEESDSRRKEYNDLQSVYVTGRVHAYYASATGTGLRVVAVVVGNSLEYARQVDIDSR